MANIMDNRIEVVHQEVNLYMEITSLAKGAQKWVGTVKANAIAANYLAKINLVMKIIKWIEPIEKEEIIREGENIHHRKIKVLTEELDPYKEEFELEGNNSIEKYDFKKEIKIINQFIDNGVRPFCLLFSMEAFDCMEQSLSKYSKKIIQLNGSDLQEINIL